MFNEIYKPFKNGEYIKNKGYYNKAKDKWSTNKPTLYNYPLLKRFQFSFYDDFEILYDFEYEKVDRIGYFLSIVLTHNLVYNKAFYIPSSIQKVILGQSYYQSIIDKLIEKGILIVESYSGGIKGDQMLKSFSLHASMFLCDRRLRVIEHYPLNRGIHRLHNLELDQFLYDQYTTIRRLEIRNDEDLKFYLSNSFKSDFFRDNHGGRCYTPITNLKKSKRKNLVLDGERLIEVDLQYSYFAVLYWLQLKLLRGEIESLTFLSKEERSKLQSIYLDPAWVNFFEEGFIGQSDFYTLASRKISLKGIDRNEFKKVINTYLNTSPNFNTRFFGFDYKAFGKRIFGDTSFWIDEIKSRPIFNDYNKKGLHTNMSKLLSSGEVFMMQTAWEVMKENFIPFLSIHDCLLVKESDVVIVSELLKQSFQDFPSIKFSIKL